MAPKEATSSLTHEALAGAIHKAVKAVPGVAMATEPKFTGSRLPKAVSTVIGDDGTIYRVAVQRVSSLN